MASLYCPYQSELTPLDREEVCEWGASPMALQNCPLTLRLCCLYPQGHRLRAEGTGRLYCLYSSSAPVKHIHGGSCFRTGRCFLPSWLQLSGLRKLSPGRNSCLRQSQVSPQRHMGHMGLGLGQLEKKKKQQITTASSLREGGKRPQRAHVQGCQHLSLP